MSLFSHDRKDLRWLYATLSGLKWKIVLLTLVRILAGTVGVGYAVCFRNIVDSAVAGSARQVAEGVGLFLGIVLGQFLLSAAGRYLDEAIRASAENRLKLRLLNTLLRRDYSRVTAVHSGEWMNRLTSDTQVVAGAAAAIVPNAAGLAARLIASAAMLLILIPGFTAVFLLCGGVLMGATLWMRRHLKRLHRDIQERDGDLRIFLTESLGSLMILKAYQQEPAALQEAFRIMRLPRLSVRKIRRSPSRS